MWLCLFTCGVTRAIHIDIVTDLSPQSFIRCLKRFISRRGLPSLVVSDNGTTFKASAKIIKSILSHPEVQHLLSEINLKWIFNVERAPWWGGFFERMIQLLKRCLRKLIGRAKLSYEELLTSVSEVELILNSRPLTYTSATDLEEPLTPSHLLTRRRLLSLPDHLCYGNSEEDYHPDSSRVTLNKRMKYLDTILKHFWSRWKREYLVELRENHRQFKGKKPDHVSVGDVVIIHDETPRGMWRLGIIEKELKGKDQETRGVVVRVKSGRGPSSFLKRPIQRLYPLEVRYQELTQEPETNTIRDPGGSGSNPESGVDSTCEQSHTDETANIESSTSRPRRRAAAEARDKIIARLMEN